MTPEEIKAELASCLALQNEVEAKRWFWPSSSLHLLNVSGLPALVDRSFGRAVKPEDGEVSLARDGREPVALFAFRGLGTEIDIRRAIGILCWFVTRTERRKWLTVREPRGVLSFIKGHRPEIRSGNVRRQINPIVRAAGEGCPLAVGEADHVFCALARYLRDHARADRVI